MNSRVSWSVDGIDPSVRERAEAAARRAGMSLNEWLNSTVGDSAPPDFRQASQQVYEPPRQQPAGRASKWKERDGNNTETEALRKAAQANATSLQAEIASLGRTWQTHVRKLDGEITQLKAENKELRIRLRRAKESDLSVATRKAIIKALHPDHAARSTVDCCRSMHAPARPIRSSVATARSICTKS